MPQPLDDLLPPPAVLHGVSVDGKTELFALLATQAAMLTGIAAGTIADALLAREALSTTGFGGGAAIPHARLDGLDTVHGLLVQLACPIDYAALDGAPVDLVVLLLAPATPGLGHRADHLKALARASRLLRDSQTAARLRAAPTTAALHDILAAYERADQRSRAA